VHGGSLRKGSLLALLNPFGEALKNGRRAKASGLVKESNLNGDGLTMGGEPASQQAGGEPHRSSEVQQRSFMESWGWSWFLCSHRSIPNTAPFSSFAGLMVFKKGGEVVYSYGEKNFGDHAPMDKVVEASQQAGAAAAAS
jgi:hypothetical protein